MRLAIISDIHANVEALRSTLAEISTQNIDHIICLGDIVGYNSDPAQCIDLLRELNALCVAGNHDRAVTGQLSMEGFDYTAAKAIRWTRRNLSSDALEYLRTLPVEASIDHHLVAVHGALHPESGKEIVRLNNDECRRLSFEALVVHPSRARLCAFGHTHQLGIFEFRDGFVQQLKGDQIVLQDDGWYLINPGTVGQPRVADRRATFLVFDSIDKRLTVHRIDYDTSVPFAKTRTIAILPIWAFLPQFVRDSLLRLPRPIRNTLKWIIKTVGI
ncbi:metallophosphoesterase [Microvirga sp. VF16]|uniref:metallophosphoesterase family protein n=1 Tax=Microvirga sp. VF16 TaxID=2807101 RepID=UPI00193DF05F|nr:metallophosphoesterase family protein [Microvirga sp. VF16]